MTIEKCLVASTGHIAAGTADVLRDNPDALPLIVYNKGDVGWLIYTHPDMTLGMGAVPTELRNLIEEAKRQDCVWLMLDCDGSFLEGFPTFNW